jgi:anti-sigma-K factor RskA
MIIIFILGCVAAYYIVNYFTKTESEADKYEKEYLAQQKKRGKSLSKWADLQRRVNGTMGTMRKGIEAELVIDAAWEQLMVDEAKLKEILKRHM